MTLVTKPAGSAHRSFRQRLKGKTVILNALAELFASMIFSLLYFIFISRYLDASFATDYVMLSFSIGLAFFAAIYIPFHTYRIHIIPFITFFVALRKQNFSLLLHKIPAQMLGTILGVSVFNAINSQTKNIAIENLQMMSQLDPGLLIFINALVAALLCYGFYTIRVLFKAKQLSGTINLSLFYVVLFATTSYFSSVSSLNPFGYLFYDLLGGQTIRTTDFLFLFLNHFAAPLISVVLLYFYVRPKPIPYKKQLQE
ncbi:MAG: hypothetical protein WEC59_04410 [Salibacteraceae bacterium]